VLLVVVVVVMVVVVVSHRQSLNLSPGAAWWWKVPCHICPSVSVNSPSPSNLQTNTRQSPRQCTQELSTVYCVLCAGVPLNQYLYILYSFEIPVPGG